MDANDLHLLTRHCPRFKSVPPDLVRAFDESKKNFRIIGGISLSNSSHTTLVGILNEDEQLAERFGIFATSGYDGIFCYWFYDDRPAGEAPVVYLEKGLRHSSVIANSVRELLAGCFAIQSLIHPATYGCALRGG